MYMMCATVAGMLLFGVVKSRPSYLMPFFWIQLCDFFFSLPSFLSSLYANPAHHGHYGSSWSSTSGGGMSGGDDVTRGSGGPFMRKFGFNHGTQAGHTSSLLIATCIILFKGYFLCVVWKCYRYLKMKEMMTLPIHLSGGGSAGLHAYHASALGLHVDMRNGGPDIVIPPGFNIPNPNILSSMAPPDYETATKSNGAQQSPPDYEAALKTQQNIRTKDDNEQNGQDQTSSSTDSSNVCLGPDNSDQSPAVVQLEPSSQVNSSNDILATGISSSPSDASASVAAGHPAPVDHQQQKWCGTWLSSETDNGLIILSIILMVIKWWLLWLKMDNDDHLENYSWSWCLFPSENDNPDASNDYKWKSIV